MIPENIASNVSLIYEINGNISKVISIYSDLSLNFADMVSQRCRKRRTTEMNNNNINGSVKSFVRPPIPFEMRPSSRRRQGGGQSASVGPNPREAATAAPPPMSI
ncbi:hypothetical protein Dsin_025101 [Dipteronia sinensis]|uniref:Protein EARLY FLOWERING 4 domain-containing protein n=1 Tax=Dipteronia sinensis TaxID=43782 RepID=A0AAD9ZVS2_9ROSI|nr:hypothetical protein Dsin_025101 [Dipteronia sinensis]